MEGTDSVAANGGQRLRRRLGRLRRGVLLRARRGQQRILELRGKETALKTQRGLLSIVVPVYNVHQYLESALQSALNQNYAYCEIIVVDDGSTDGSGEIADRVAATDRRVRVIHQSNAGLGAARNTGLRYCSGEFLAFFDSDDVLERDGYAAAISALRETGSDFAVSPYRFLKGGRLSQPGRWIREAHAVERRATTLNAFPRIQANVVAWSKVYRREFFLRAVGGYDEGVVWEDQVPATRSYVAARRFDVLTSPIVRWRTRDESTSITQQSGSLANLMDRIDVIGKSLDVLHVTGHDEARLERILQVLEADTFTIRRVHDGNIEYWQAVREALTRMLSLVPRDVLMQRIPTQHRVLYSLLLADDSEAAIEYIDAGGLSPHAWVFEEQADGLIHGKMPGWDAPAYVPTWAFIASSWQLPVQTWVESADWTSSGVLELRGHAYLPGVIADSQVFELVLRDPRAGIQISVPVEHLDSTNAGLLTKHEFLDYPRSGWRAKVDLDSLARRREELGVNRLTMQLMFTVGAAGARSTGALATVGFTVDNAYRQAIRITQRTEAWGKLMPGKGLCIDIVDVGDAVHVSGVQISGRTLSLSTSDQVDVTAIELVHPGWSYRLPLKRTYGVSVDVPTSLGDLHEVRVRLVDREGKVRSTRIDSTSVVEVEAGAELFALEGGFSQLFVYSAEHNAVLREIRMRGSDLEIDLDAVGIAAELARVRLVGRRMVAVGSRRRLVDGTVTYAFELEQPPSPGWQRQLIPGGSYTLELSDEKDDRVRAVCLPSFDRQMPLREIGDSGPLVSVHHGAGREARLSVNVRGRSEGFTRRAKRMALDTYRSDASELVDQVYFQCLNGDQVNDSQLAVARYLTERHPEVAIVWGVLDRSVRVPAGHSSVVIDTPAYFTALATSRVLCFNHEVPVYLMKRDGQIVVQTYHGHPFKMMGTGRWKALAYTDLQVQRSLDWRSHWDVLLSPTSLATELYRENFPVSAEIVELGHPRNDRLVTVTDEERQKIRRDLGIDDGKKAVLYAPTWRDYLASSPWASKMVTFIDPHELASRLGPEYCVLWRAHPAHGRHGSYRAATESQVIDVTYHPDVNDLLIASDIGVFDYSSVRFDYVLTGKPMVFFVPDKDAFFRAAPSLIPFDETTPGEQVTTSQSLIEAIRDVDVRFDSWRDAYSAFRQRFAGLDDGKASARLGEEIMSRMRQSAS